MKKTLLYSFLMLAALCSCTENAEEQTESGKKFPVSVQYSPVPSGEGWHSADEQVTEEMMQATIQNFISHGVSHISSHAFSGNNAKETAMLNYAQEQGMMVDCLTGGIEGFHRVTPPEHSVFTQEYTDMMKARVEPVLGGVRNIQNAYTIFPFMDEPFHTDTTCFDYSEAAAMAFSEKFGYPMPATFAEARKDPVVYVDFINFQSSTFSVAWKKIYDEVKKLDSRPMVTITHDSHNSMGAGAGSNSVWAVDDIFHWGADFADMFIYDIYPYTCEDYRVGESGLVYKPRMSQFHWTLAQMRNLTETYGKELGFWVGTFNHAWFSRFLDDTRRSQYWMERELSYTAIAGGANFLMTGFNVPEDAKHWDDFGEGMCTIQKEGGALLDAKKPKAKACFLFPRTQHILLNREYFNVALTFELCMRAFGEMDVIHEEQLTDDSLLGYDILVLADVEILPETVAENIRSFVSNGGTVIADCVPQTNEKLQKNDILNDVFGVSAADTYRVNQEGLWIPCTTVEPLWLFVKDWKAPEKVFDKADGFKVVSPRHCVANDATVNGSLASGEPLLMEKKYGDGHAYLFGFCLQDTYLQTFIDEDEIGRAELQSLVRQAFLKTGIQSSVYSTNPDVEVALRKGKSEAFALVINHEAENPTAVITLSDLGFKVRKVVDVQSGSEIKFKKDGNSIQFNICPAKDSEGGVTRLIKISGR